MTVVKPNALLVQTPRNQISANSDPSWCRGKTVFMIDWSTLCCNVDDLRIWFVSNVLSKFTQFVNSNTTNEISINTTTQPKNVNQRRVY
jgi:hypothetical protein